jgi:hypothetical protein
LWHRRETRRQTEKTNLNLQHREKPAYSPHFAAATGEAVSLALQTTQTTGGTPYQMNYGYDLAGEMTSETYPSRTRVVNTQYDAAGRIAQLQAGTTTYASAFQYAAHGAVSQVTLGNTLVEKTTFNNRLQPTEIMLGQGGNVFDLQYSYATQGQNNNNGNLLEQKIYVGGTSGSLVGDQAYGYDKLNRLISVTETYNGTTSWARTSKYDQFGNMWVTGTQGIIPTAATPQASTVSLQNDATAVLDEHKKR